MEIGIMIDEISQLHPAILKALSTKAVFEQICYFNPFEQPDPDTLYLTSSTEMGRIANFPNHLIVTGNQAVPEACLEHSETVIQVPETNMLELYQIITKSLISFNNWKMSMMRAILQTKNIKDFLDIAAEKLSNPVALFDSELILIATAGQFSEPYSGTIWDKVVNLGYTPMEFYTLEEQQEISKTYSITEPILYYASKDKNHTYATAHIWVDRIMYWSLGLVDINTPFTDGQVCIIKHITEGLKLYIQNDDTYRQISNNNPYFIINLLEGIQVDEKVVSHYLRKRNWNIHDSYYLLNILSPIPITSPDPSLSYVKRISMCFPESLVSIYENSIVAVVHVKDCSAKAIADNQDFKQLLSNCNMICGISSKFSNLLNLKYYYIQSVFAIDYCKQHPDSIIQNYEECYCEHVLQSIENASDIKCYCYPKILEMRESEEKNQFELIHTLHVFLLNGRSLALTSEALYIHRNTLIYRLDKLSNILKVDLKNLTSDQLFYLLFSCVIAEHL